MIPRISKGRSASGAMRYDHSRGRREQHVNPHKIGGTVPGRTWQARAHTMDEHARTMRPELAGKHVHRTALRLAPEDRRLTDQEWRAVSEKYVKDMGFDGCPWEATRHADDHVHLTVSRVQWDGELAPDGRDFARAQTAARGLEREHGLIDASQRYDRDHPQVSHGERESAARREVVPERDQLRDAVRSAEGESGRTREGFEAALAGRGVRAEANAAKTGRVSGYRYGLVGHVDAKGEQVWFKGSQLGRDQTWAKTAERIKVAPQLTTGEKKQVPEQQEQTPSVREVGSFKHDPRSTPKERAAAEQAIREHAKHLDREDAAAAARRAPLAKDPAEVQAEAKTKRAAERDAHREEVRPEIQPQSKGREAQAQTAAAPERLSAAERDAHREEVRPEIQPESKGREAQAQTAAAPERLSAAERVRQANTQSKGRDNERPEAVQGHTPGPRHPREERDQPMRETTPAGATEAQPNASREGEDGGRESAAERVQRARGASSREPDKENER